MIKVEIRCNYCDSSVDEKISYKDSMPHWGQSLWKSALSKGWVRQKPEHIPACADCKNKFESFSTVVLPIEPLPIIGYLQCDFCDERFTKGRIALDESFARQLRKDANVQGWRQLSIVRAKTFNDYCSSCVHRSRPVLLKLVWSKSTEKVGKELGVSGRAIGKRCKRLGVPKPPVGFWAKYQAGHIRDCISQIPLEVIDELGEDFMSEFYPLDDAFRH